MLPVSLDYLRPVFCEQCCQCLWIIFVLCFVIMLPVTLDYLRHVFCEPNIASVSGLSTPCVFWIQWCQCLWIIFVLCFVNPMLPVTLEDNPESLVLGAQNTVTKIIFVTVFWEHKTQDSEDNPESLATLWSQCCTGLWRLSSSLCNIVITKHRTKIIFVTGNIGWPNVAQWLKIIRHWQHWEQNVAGRRLSSSCALSTQCCQCL